MIKKISASSVLLLSLALLVYSATRSVHFISMTLPPERRILAWFGLFAIEFGTVAWLLAYLYGSHGWQRPIALIMTAIDMLGSLSMFTMDTLYQMGQTGMTRALTQDELRAAALVLSFIISLNIATTVAHHLVDPGRLYEQAEEEAFDELDSAVLKQIRKNAQELAERVAPMLAEEWTNGTRERYMRKFSVPIDTRPQPLLWQKAFDTEVKKLVRADGKQEVSAVKPPFINREA